MLAIIQIKNHWYGIKGFYDQLKNYLKNFYTPNNK